MYPKNLLNLSTLAIVFVICALLLVLVRKYRREMRDKAQKENMRRYLRNRAYAQMAEYRDMRVKEAEDGMKACL